MKTILTLVLFALSASVYGQLYVQPTATEASYIYVEDTYIFVEEDINLVSNASAPASTNGFPSIALRQGAQLLQRSPSTPNTGTGLLSVFQEGTADAYAYNYWSSPVGLSNAANPAQNGRFKAGATQNETVLFVPSDILESNITLESPSLQGTSTTGSAFITKYWLWRKPGGTNYTSWQHVSNTGTVLPGYGFTMKGVDGTDATTFAGETTANNSGASMGAVGQGQRFDFRGRPNTGNATISVGGALDEIFVGNPYPSALDLNYFLFENSGSGAATCGGTAITRTDRITGIAYFWDSDPAVRSHFLEEYEGGYGAYMPGATCDMAGTYMPAIFSTYNDDGTLNAATGGTGNTYNRRFSPVGQGFFVYGTNASTITMSNNYRTYVPEGSNSDFKSSTEVVPGIGVNAYYPNVNDMMQLPQVRININMNDTNTRQLVLGFWDDATDGYDPAMDAKNVSLVSTDVYFEIEEKGDYISNVIPFDDLEKAVPLTVKVASTSQFNVSVGYDIEYPHNELYLYDARTGVFHDILHDEVRYMLEPGLYEDRFYLRFKKKESEEDEEEEDEDGETLSVEDSILESFEITQNNPAGQLEISNPKSIGLSNVSLFDITGKQIFAKQNLGTEATYTFPTNSLSDGIYVVRIITDEGLMKARKLTVRN
jgi:hypothetical protein